MPGPPRRRWMSPIALIVTLSLSIATITGTETVSAAPQEADPYEASTRLLRKAVVPNRNSSRLTLLSSLRQLRDSSLRTLYTRMLENETDWQVQVHAVLGLAETSPEEVLDVELMKQIDADGQEHVIANAIDAGLLPAGKMRELLAWEGIQPLSRVMLVAELVAAGEDVSTDPIRSFATHSDLRVAGLASCLLAELESEGHLAAYRERLSALQRRERDPHMLWITEAIRQYKLERALPVVYDALETKGAAREVVYAAVLASVQLDEQNGLERWRQALGPSPSPGRALRFCMFLLSIDRPVPTEYFDLLGTSEGVLDTMIAAGRAKATGAELTPQIIAVLELGNVRGTNWALAALEEMPDDEARVVYEHVLDDLDQRRPGQSDRISMAVTASEKLFDIDADDVIERVGQSEDNSLEQEVLLLGLFESSSPRVAEAARAVDRIGLRRADSLALILLAKFGAILDANDLEQLGKVAAGGGRVSEMLQVQAAWLYLKRSDRTADALDAVFAAP